MLTPLTTDELRDLPLIVDIETAGRAFGLGRKASYALARSGDFPVPVYKLTKFYRVRRSDLLNELGITPAAV